MQEGAINRVRDFLAYRRLARTIAQLRNQTTLPAVLHHYLSNMPDLNGPVQEAALCALDLETTGLDARNDRIVSAGWVFIERMVITTSGARHLVLQQESTLPATSVVVHGITDQAIGNAQTLSTALTEVFDALAGRFLVAHHAVIETGFLQAACHQVWGVKPPILAIDTLAYERSRQQRMGQDLANAARTGALRLMNLRQKYGLPDYINHHALSDALACAELFLAQINHAGAAASPVRALVSAPG